MTFAFDWDVLEQTELARAEASAAGHSSTDASSTVCKLGDMTPLSSDPIQSTSRADSAVAEPAKESSDDTQLEWQSSPDAWDAAPAAKQPVKPFCIVAKVGEHYEIVNKLLILRSGQELRTSEVGRLNKGMTLEIVEIGVGRRVKVLTQTGKTGWASLQKEDGTPLLVRVYLTAEQAKKFSPKEVVRRGSELPQPGDGNCLFHSLNFGMRVLKRASGHPEGGEQLRLKTIRYMQDHARDRFGDCTLEQWVKWETEQPIDTYLRKMSVRPWSFAGAVEMAAFARMTNVNVEVYEPCGTGYKKISAIEAPRATDDTITVVYKSRVHYDALVLDM